MKTLFQNILVISAIFIAASIANAQYSAPRGGYYTGSSLSYGHQNEIITNFTNGSFYSGERVKNGGSVTTIQVQGKYLRTLTANIQAGGQVGLLSLSGGGSETLLTALAVGVYNFDVNFKQSFFAEGGLGIFPVQSETTGDYESKFGLYVGGGKRFPIWERVSYIPTLALVKKGDLDFGFDIQFLNFSIMF